LKSINEQLELKLKKEEAEKQKLMKEVKMKEIK